MRLFRRLLACGVGTALVLAAVRRAQAALPECAVSASPLIALSTQIEDERAVSTGLLEDHLAAALNARSFRLCRGGSEPKLSLALLEIRVVAPEGGPVTALIVLSDAVTGKRVERQLELSGIPTDSRPLAIASSADELLRASWAELTLIDAPRPVVTPPPAVTHAVENTLKPVKLQTAYAELDVEGSAAVQRYLTAFGARVRVGYWFSPHFGGYFASSTASGLRRSATHGSVSLGAVGLETGVAYAWLPVRESFGIDVEGGARLLRLSFSASPGPNADSNSFADWSLVANARARGWLGSRAVRGTLSLAALYGLRPSRAYDEARIVTSNQGAGLEATLGVALFF